MSPRMYLIVFDLSTIATTAVRQLLKRNRNVFHRWWNHLPFAFLVVSDQTAEQITDFVHERAAGAAFLIAEINPENANGVLPDTSWTWILERANELSHAESA